MQNLPYLLKAWIDAWTQILFHCFVFELASSYHEQIYEPHHPDYSFYRFAAEVRGGPFVLVAMLHVLATGSMS